MSATKAISPASPVTPAPEPAGAPASSRRIAFGPFVLDGPAGQLLRDGQAVELAPKPWAVLAFLAARPGVLVSKDELLDAVWGHRFLSDSVLKVTMNNLRNALGEDARSPRWLLTVPKRGYRFCLPEEDAGSAPPADDAQAGLPSSSPASANRLVQAPSPPGGNLPPLRGHLLGREQETLQLSAWLGQQRLITITGPGGVGKTRLSLAVANFAPPADGVWLLRLETLHDAEAVPSALARALGLSDAAGRDAQSLGRALATLHLRLVLDNAEHLAEGLAVLLVGWLEAAPGLQVLVTSQRPLRLASEQLLPLEPLALPAADEQAEQMASSPAVALLLQRISAVMPQFQPGAQELIEAGAIARALDGMPLALELAAARVPLLGLAGVRQRLDTRLRLLTQGRADAPLRHRSLRAAVEWSVSLLPALAAQLLARLSAFVAPFTVEGALAIGEGLASDDWELLDALQTLRDMALVVEAIQTANPGAPNSPSAPRLRLYESVRLLAAELLISHEDEEAAFTAHRAWMLRLFKQSAAQVCEAGQRIWVQPLEGDTDDLRIALARGMAALAGRQDAQLCEEIASLAAAAAPACCRSGVHKRYLFELLGRLRQAAEQLPQPSAVIQRQLDFLQVVLATSGLLGSPADALSCALRAWPDWQEKLPRSQRVYLRYQTSMLMVRLRMNEALIESAQVLQQQLTPQSSVYERRFVAWIDALIARNAGRSDLYLQFWHQMLEQSRALGDSAEAWTAAMGVAQALFLEDRGDEAVEVLDQTVDEMRQLGRLRAHGVVAGQAALLRVCRDDSPETLNRLREAVRILQADGMLWWVADALAWVPMWQGRLQDACRVQACADALVVARDEQRGPVFSRIRQALQQHLLALAQRQGHETLPQTEAPPLDEEAALQLALGRF